MTAAQKNVAATPLQIPVDLNPSGKASTPVPTTPFNMCRIVSKSLIKIQTFMFI